MKKYELKLSSGTFNHSTLELGELAAIAETLKKMAIASVAHTLFGTSQVTGRAAERCRKVATIYLRDIRKGSVILDLEAHILQDFDKLFRGPDHLEDSFMAFRKDTALDVMALTLNKALHDPEQMSHDSGLLTTLSSLKDRFTLGDEQLTLRSAGNDSQEPLLNIRKPQLEYLAKAAKSVPAPQKTILVGALDAIRHRSREVTLVTPSGNVQVTLPESISPEAVAGLLGRQVTATGILHRWSNGRPHLLQAIHLRATQTGDIAFEDSTPSPEAQLLQQAKTKHPAKALAALMTGWPGDESLDDLLANLKD